MATDLSQFTVPNDRFDVAQDNAAKLDSVLNGPNAVVTTRTGKGIQSIDKIIQTIASTVNRGNWTTATSYQVKDLVLDSGTWYFAVVAHTSGATFAGDIANWRVHQGVTTPQGDDRYGPIFTTVAAMVALNPVAIDGIVVDLSVGMPVAIDDYADGNNSGIIFGQVVAAATGTADGGSFIDLNNGLQFKQNFPGDINIKLFGAVGDGVADDAPNFNAAFIFTNGKTITITVSDGTYLLSSVLSMGSDTTLKSGKSVIYKRNQTEGMLLNDLGVTGATGGFTGNGNIAIIGGIWDGNSVAFFNGFNCFGIGYAENVIIKDLTVLDVINAHGIDLSASKNVLIDNCRFLGFADAVPPARDFSEAIQLDPNTPVSFGFGAQDRTHCLNVRVRSCEFGDNPDQVDIRFKAWPVGVGGHVAVNDRFQNEIIISENKFDGCLFAGVREFKWKASTITNNVFTGCERDVHVTPVSFDIVSADNPDGTPSGQGQAGENTIIDSNQFIDTVGDCILFTAPEFDVGESFKHNHVVISNNAFDTNTSAHDGCDLRWIHNLSITGNSFNNLNAGIHVQYCDNITVSGNTIADITQECILANEDAPSGGEDKRALGFSSDLVISGNTLKEGGRTGINVTGDFTRLTITGNTLTNMSTEVGTRSGMQVSASSSDITITGNSVFDDAAPIKPAKGIDVTGSCSNAYIANNHVDDAIGELVDNAATGLSSTQGLMVNGTPEGAVTAPQGSTAINMAGGASTTFYVKESGTGNTGWAAK
jgi:parallel beta-helix repeat protein